MSPLDSGEESGDNDGSRWVYKQDDAPAKKVPFLAPPRIPAARTKELRAAFNASIADPALIADANRFNLELRPMTGEELQAKIEQLYSTSEAVLTRARIALEPPK